MIDSKTVCEKMPEAVLLKSKVDYFDVEKDMKVIAYDFIEGTKELPGVFKCVIPGTFDNIENAKVFYLFTHEIEDFT